jgi:ribosome biogenesis protein
LISFQGHKEAVSAVLWSEDGEMISSSWDHTIKVWDAELGGIKSEIIGNKSFFDLHWSTLNRLVITASADRHVRLYDPRSKGLFFTTRLIKFLQIYCCRGSTCKINIHITHRVGAGCQMVNHFRISFHFCILRQAGQTLGYEEVSYQSKNDFTAVIIKIFIVNLLTLNFVYLSSPKASLYDMSGHQEKVLCCDWSNPELILSGSSDNSLRVFKAKHAMS